MAADLRIPCTTMKTRRSPAGDSAATLLHSHQSVAVPGDSQEMFHASERKKLGTPGEDRRLRTSMCVPPLAPPLTTGPRTRAGNSLSIRARDSEAGRRKQDREPDSQCPARWRHVALWRDADCSAAGDFLRLSRQFILAAPCWLHHGLRCSAAYPRPLASRALPRQVIYPPPATPCDRLLSLGRSLRGRNRPTPPLSIAVRQRLAETDRSGFALWPKHAERSAAASSGQSRTARHFGKGLVHIGLRRQNSNEPYIAMRPPC